MLFLMLHWTLEVVIEDSDNIDEFLRHPVDGHDYPEIFSMDALDYLPKVYKVDQ